MGKRRKTEDSNSLDLLLDTMCNTFGGVMFIAISLIIISAMLPPPQPEEKTMTPQAFEQLKEELEQLKIEQQKQEKVVPIEVLELQKKVIEKTKIKIELEEKIILNQTQIFEKFQLLESLKIEETQVKEQLATFQGELEIVIDHLNKTPSLNRLVFKRLEAVSDHSTPYYFIIKNQQLYRIGLEGDTPHRDVHAASTLQGLEFMPAQGVPLLIGNELNPEAYARITSIPKKRYAHFAVYPESSHAFFILLNALKAQKLPHPWLPMNPKNKVKIRIQTEVKHER